MRLHLAGAKAGVAAAVAGVVLVSIWLGGDTAVPRLETSRKSDTPGQTPGMNRTRTPRDVTRSAVEPPGVPVRPGGGSGPAHEPARKFTGPASPGPPPAVSNPPASALSHSGPEDEPLSKPEVEALSERAPIPILAGATIPTTGPVPPGSEYSGLWLLPSPGRTAGGSARTREAPQYIQLSIHSEADGMIFGDYSARYEAPDRPISPEVEFAFRGPATGNATAFDWESRDGSRGTIELKLLHPHSLRATWRVTSFGSSLGIAGGAAVVIRNSEH